MREWILTEVNYGYVKDHPYEVAVQPMGATEPHNLHLPYGTDLFESDEIASRACEAAFKQGAKVVMLPTIPYGTETNQMEFPLAMNLNPSTLGMILKDVADSLAKHGIYKLLILNSHGGNDFKPILREMYGKTPVHIFLCDWLRCISADVQPKIFEDVGEHAGELETALGMAYFPDLVDTDPATGKITADDGATNETQLEAVNKGWVSITRPWHLLTKNTGVGNPHPATAEKGRQLMDVLVERLSSFLIELANKPIDDRFPY